MRNIVVYGSLKKGFHNHARFGLSNYEKVADVKVKGAMYLVHGQYPKLYEPGTSNPALEREHDAEVYTIPPNLYDVLDAMETSSGYVAKEIEVGGLTATIFYADKDWKRIDNTWIEAYTKDVIH